MTTLSIRQDQNLLLNEIVNLVPKYDETEVMCILKATISNLRKCRRITETDAGVTDMNLSPEVASLIGIVPTFDKEDISNDERLKHILTH